jgi:hypothetical protein
MVKGKLDPVAKAERRLAKAQAALKGALAQNAKAELRGKKTIEKARALAEQWRAKAQSRVQRRQTAVARAEAQLSDANGRSAASAPEVVVISDGTEGLTEREAQVLEALRLVSQDGGAIPGAWQRASQLSNGTFSRVRRTLMERGLVVRKADGQRNIRYVLAQDESVQGRNE